MEKFFQIFQDFHFDISFPDALLLMPKFASTIKSLLTNKDKLFELTKIPLNENCSVMLLKKLPEKLGDHDKFLIPCDFPRMDVCHTLADLGASINLMPFSIWKKLSLPKFTPTQMTLELLDRSITRPKGVVEDVFVKVWKFHFPTDFVVVDFEANPRVPIILGRSFLRTDFALIDVYGEEITLWVNDEAVTFNLNQTTRYSSTYDDLSVNELISLMLLERRSDFILEDIEAYLKDDSISLEIDHANCDPKEDICLIEKLLNDDPFQLPPMDLKEVIKAKSLIEEPPELELKDLSSHLEYAYLEENDKLQVIILKDLKDDEKEALLNVLEYHKRAIAWKITDIKGIDPQFCTHKILMEEDFKPLVQSQRRVNLKIHEVIKKREAWERFKEMLRACPHHRFTELAQIDTLYNGLNDNDQDFLNVATGGNLLTVEESCVTYGAHYNCDATNSNQPSVCMATGTYNQVAPQNRARNYMAPPGFASVQIVKVVPNNPVQQGFSNEFSSYNKVNDQMMRNMQSQINSLKGEFKNEIQNTMKSQQTVLMEQKLAFQNMLSGFFQNQSSTSGTLSSNTIPNPKGEMKAITNRSGVSYEGPSSPTNPSPKKVVERETEETTDKEQTNFQGSIAHIKPPVTQILEPDVSKTLPKPNIPYPSFADGLLLMLKFASTIKSFLTNKDKLFELAKIPLNENCSTMLLKKLPEKLGDPGKFLIPCDFLGMDICHALADLDASINLMPLSIWKKLSLPKLTPTRMTLELADRSITRPKGVAEDIFIKVGKFYFLTDFVVVDFEADPRVPLILGRSFLSTGRTLIDVYGEEITLRVNDKVVTFNLNQTTRYSSTYDDLSIKAYLKDESISPEIDHADCDPEGDICLIEKLLNNDPFQLPPKNLKQREVVKEKSLIEEPSKLKLKDLPSHLEYAYLEGVDKLPVIIAKDLKDNEKEALLKVLKSHKRAIAWKITDIKGFDPWFSTHKILMEEDYKPAVQSQRRVKPKIHEVIKKEVIKLLDAGMIYSISDSPWVSPIHCVPKKGDITVVENENNELIPTRLVAGWRVCIDYRKLNDATCKDHFPIPFMDQMLEQLAGNEFYCFLDGFSGYFQIPINPPNQEKTTFTCPYGTFAYRRMPFGLCNAPGIFQRTLKKKLTDSPILVIPDWNLPFELMCDAIDFAIEKEMLAVVYAFEKFRPYLVLSKSMVYTDHSTLKYLLSKQDAKPRLIRWVLLLQEFDIIIRDKKGTENLAADHLSRLEKPHKDVFENKDINENFPLKTRDLKDIDLRFIEFIFRFHIDSKFSNKVSVIVVLDLSKVANPLYLLRDTYLFKLKDPQVVSEPGVKTPLFASMLVQPQSQADQEEEEEEEVEMPIIYAPPSPTNAPSSPPQDPTPTPYAIPPQAQPSTPLASPPQAQPTKTSKSSMSLLITLMETYASLSQKIEAINADEDITLLDVEKDKEVVTMDAEPQGRIDQEDVNAVSKGVNTAKPTMDQKLHDEEVQKDAAWDKQEKDDMERAQVLQKQYDDKEE
nr:DNA-directed DNA polymerase [Tanacetum cinerariifolium]